MYLRPHAKDLLTSQSIVFVQGLGAHPYYTWLGHDQASATKSQMKGTWLEAFRPPSRHRPDTKATTEAGVFWPRDLLPQHLPPARIATYSYKSDWHSKMSKISLRECGEQFLQVVDISRQDESVSVPKMNNWYDLRPLHNFS